MIRHYYYDQQALVPFELVNTGRLYALHSRDIFGLLDSAVGGDVMAIIHKYTDLFVKLLELLQK